LFYFQAIIENVKRSDRIEVFRPDTKNLKCELYVVEVMKSCWGDNPEERPDFMTVSNSLSPMRKGMLALSIYSMFNFCVRKHVHVIQR